MIECVLNYAVTYARKVGVKLDNKHWYDRVPRSVETRYETTSVNRQNYF
jgi:hypothetical protein